MYQPNPLDRTAIETSVEGTSYRMFLPKGFCVIDVTKEPFRQWIEDQESKRSAGAGAFAAPGQSPRPNMNFFGLCDEIASVHSATEVASLKLFGSSSGLRKKAKRDPSGDGAIVFGNAFLCEMLGKKAGDREGLPSEYAKVRIEKTMEGARQGQPGILPGLEAGMLSCHSAAIISEGAAASAGVPGVEAGFRFTSTIMLPDWFVVFNSNKPYEDSVEAFQRGFEDHKALVQAIMDANLTP